MHKRKVKIEELDEFSRTVFEYLEQLADMKDDPTKSGRFADDGEQNDDDFEKILTKHYKDLRKYGIDEDAILLQYLHPDMDGTILKGEMPLFPFRFNKSQEEAVEIALNNDFSIIQGPPGTGKTQTILNILINLLLENKTALVVSNSNEAIKNINDKLKEEGLDFLCATLGKKENQREFFGKGNGDEQCLMIGPSQKEKIAKRKQNTEEWENIKVGATKDSLIRGLESLDNYFEAETNRARLKRELDGLENEYIRFKENRGLKEDEKKSELRRLLPMASERITKKIVKFDKKSSSGKPLGLLQKFVAKYFYGIKSEGELSYFDLAEIFKFGFYEKRRKEIKNEIKEADSFIKNYERVHGTPENLYKQCMNYVKREIACKMFVLDDIDKEFCWQQKVGQYGTPFTYFDFNKSFFNYYPIVLSTTWSARKCVGYRGPLYDYLIMDEASQVDLITGALSLSCAKRAIIVGDEKQLPNVIQERTKEQGRYTESEKVRMANVYSVYKNKIGEGYSYDKSFLSSVTEVFNKRQETPLVGNTLLREHYRCHPKIINFCNEQFYNNQLIVMTKDKNEKDTIAVVHPSESRTRNHENVKEAFCVKEVLKTLTSEERAKGVGIISPYCRQAALIKSETGCDAFTVHKYQGQEKDTIIISTVDDVYNSFSDDSKLLNVAISRAKKRLILINSYPSSVKSTSNIGAFIDYVKLNNFEYKEMDVNSIFDFLYSKIAEEHYRYMNYSNRVSIFDSEVAMQVCLNKILSDEKYSHFSFLYAIPLKEIVSRRAKETIDFTQEEKEFIERDSHIDFCIYNKVSKKNLLAIEVDGKQHQTDEIQRGRDALKNSILKKIGLDLLRFKTTGYGEENAIRARLDTF